MRTHDGGQNPRVHPHEHLIEALVQDQATKFQFKIRTRPGEWGCIEWTGAWSRGYGTMRCNGRAMVAHRVAWIFRHGQNVPLDLEIDHLCCNPGCVNPDHLDAVTPQENARRIKHPPPDWVSVGNKKYPRRRKLKGTDMNTAPNPLFPAGVLGNQPKEQG